MNLGSLPYRFRARMFSDGDVARVDIAAGSIENRTPGARLRGRGLPELVLGILNAGGLFTMLQRDGYVPADLSRVAESEDEGRLDPSAFRGSDAP